MQLRDYQTESVSAVYEHLRTRRDNPCVVLPTAAGKTPVLATICRDAVTRWNGRVLVLAHVKELLEQAVDKLHVMAPDLWNQIGVYSAGLGKRDKDHPIIVAGIQSVYKRAFEMGSFNLVLVDEAHMIPPDGEGMYQTFLKEALLVNPAMRVIGLTATPYRLTSGMICGPDNILNHVCYEAGVRELMIQGYLSQVTSKAGAEQADTSGLHRRAGEFVAGEAEEAMELVSESACREILLRTEARHSVLLFASGVNHAEHIKQIINAAGQRCELITGMTPKAERAELLQRFKDRQYKHLVNVDVLTTGFDAPNIDCVCLLRATLSPGLYYQMVGRGFRLFDGKSNCLVLDYGGNIERHGPVDMLSASATRKSQGGIGDAPMKQCPECNEMVLAGCSCCTDCGYEFPPPEPGAGHGDTASDASILSGEVTYEVHEVTDVAYMPHEKKNAPEGHPKTLRVDYWVGWNTWHSEWVCVEHEGFAGKKAIDWWRRRCKVAMPADAEMAAEMATNGALAMPLEITLKFTAGKRFAEITECVLGEIPDYREPGWDGMPLSPIGGIDDEDIPF